MQHFPLLYIFHYRRLLKVKCSALRPIRFVDRPKYFPRKAIVFFLLVLATPSCLPRHSFSDGGSRHSLCEGGSLPNEGGSSVFRPLTSMLFPISYFLFPSPLFPDVPIFPCASSQRHSLELVEGRDRGEFHFFTKY